MEEEGRQRDVVEGVKTGCVELACVCVCVCVLPISQSDSQPASQSLCIFEWRKTRNVLHYLALSLPDHCSLTRQKQGR